MRESDRENQDKSSKKKLWMKNIEKLYEKNQKVKKMVNMENRIKKLKKKK